MGKSEKEDLLIFCKILITLVILAVLAIGTIALCEKLEKQDKYKLDYQIETYIDDDGIVYKILRDSNGDTVYVDTRYEK